MKIEVTEKEAQRIFLHRIVNVKVLLKAFAPCIVGFIIAILAAIRMDAPDKGIAEWMIVSFVVLLFIASYIWSIARLRVYEKMARKIAEEQIKDAEQKS